MQVCEFRDQYDNFQAVDAEVFGVSADAKDSHQAFAQKHALPYHLLMDPRKTLRRLWRVPKVMMLLDGRVSYLIDKEGVCRFIYNSASKPKAHIQQCLRKLKEITQ